MYRQIKVTTNADMKPQWHSFNKCGRLQAYQLFKARAYGADAVLLIAAVLPNNDLEYLVAAAKKIGLQSLIEVGCTCIIPPA